MGWPEIIFLVVAAAILAGNQALKDAPFLTLRFPSLKPPGWLSYVPLIFVILAGGIYGARQLAGDGGSATGNAEASANPVVTGFPAERVKGFFQGRTTAEAERMAAPYIGARATIRGRVGNAYSAGDGLNVRLDFEAWGPHYVLHFNPHQSLRAARLQIGDPINARCVFRGRADQLSITFQDCVISLVG